MLIWLKCNSFFQSFFSEISFLISSSLIIAFLSRSRRSILPGCNLHFEIIDFSSTGNKPISEAKINLLSLVKRYLAGLKPFLSKSAPICLPSVNAMFAGPSQGSIRGAWYS